MLNMRSNRAKLVCLITLCIITSLLFAPVRAEEEYNLIATLHSPEPESNANFGCSVAVSGDIVVVGEYSGDIEGYSSPGKAHIFTTDGTLLASLQAPEPSNNARFGYTVAIRGNVIVVGETYADPDGIRTAGRAHIFNSNGNHIATLQAPEPEAMNKFGYSVDTDGEIVVVGEYSVTSLGGVYLFDTDGNYIASIQDPEQKISGGFGVPAAVSGEIIVAAASFAMVEGLQTAGKAYIFDYDGNLIATLQSPEPTEEVFFGYPLDVSGDIVLITEWRATVEGKDKAGLVHIYDSEGNHKAILKAPEPEETAVFGNSVVVSGNIIAVGEPQRNGETSDEGRAYIYDSDGSLVAILQSPEPYPGAQFGWSVAVSEDIAAVGEPFASVEGMYKAGMVHIFQLGAAAFTSSGLNIDPNPVSKGKTVTVSVECGNTGTISGEYQVVLTINGAVEDEKTVTIGPDETTSVSFEVTAGEAGEYSVDVNGLTGSYDVEKAQTGIPGFPLESIVISMVLAVLVSWFIHKQR